MSDEITPILSAVNGRAIANLVPQDEKTFIVDAVTGQKIAVIDGFFGGGGKAKIMTTEERTAITPEEGQMIFDSTLGALFVGDGATPGGTAVGGGEDDVPGYRLDSDGEFLNFNPIADIINVTGSTVTLEPDKAYKIVTTNGAVNISANPPAANKWGYEGHAEIFVGATGYAVFDTSKIVLANQLEPDSVNNCTLRFHDGMCYVAVEDHIAGYIVVAATGTTAGTLPYGITSATQEYIAFDATTNGSTIELSGATASGEKHLVGNGYTSTTLTGAVDCGASKFTVANLALQDVVVGGGVMTLGDAYIPSGSTVAVSGGGLAVEKVTGDGGVIDLNSQGRLYRVPTGGSAYIGGVVISGGSCAAGQYGGAFAFGDNNGILRASGCVFASNYAEYGGAIHIGGATTNQAYFSSCTFENNSAGGENNGRGIIYALLAELHLTDCTFGGSQVIATASNDSYTQKTFLAGKFKTESVIRGAGSVTISAGAILDLTGNTNATPIAPGGGITFEAGGATVLYSSGAVSGSYMMDNVTLPAGAKLTNTAVVTGVGTTVDTLISSGSPASISGAVISSVFFTFKPGAQLTLEDTSIPTTYVYLDSVNRSGGLATLKGRITIPSTGAIGYNIQSSRVPMGVVTIASGAIIDRSSASGETAFRAGSFVVEGDFTYIAYGGAEVTIHDGTYTHIYPDGTTVPPQE